MLFNPCKSPPCFLVPSSFHLLSQVAWGVLRVVPTGAPNEIELSGHTSNVKKINQFVASWTAYILRSPMSRRKTHMHSDRLRSQQSSSTGRRPYQQVLPNLPPSRPSPSIQPQPVPAPYLSLEHTAVACLLKGGAPREPGSIHTSASAAIKSFSRHPSSSSASGFSIRINRVSRINSIAVLPYYAVSASAVAAASVDTPGVLLRVA